MRLDILKDMRWYVSASTRLGLALLFASLASVGLFVAGAYSNHSWAFAYLIWNLFLAWVPVFFSFRLEHVLQRKLWSSWEAILLTVLWLGFLPNTFYMISDFIHIQEIRRVDLLYDTVMMSSFIFNGVILGFMSLYTVHRLLLQRLKWITSAMVVSAILLVCSFAIYLGRELRWNTWDVLVNPAGILLDVSDRVLHPMLFHQTYTTTVTFFVLLGSLYVVTWQLVRALRSQRPA